MLHYNKPKKNTKGKKVLVNVSVSGSTGPIRFLVNEEELVVSVIKTTLKCYARQGQLPLLGSSFRDFLIHSPDIGHEALTKWKPIGSFGARNFVLFKKPEEKKLENGYGIHNSAINGANKKRGRFKAWINKSLSLIVSSN